MGEFKARFDRYEIQEELSHGSMGVVYRAFDPMLQRDIAIKVLAQGRVANKEDVARFMREARAVARLSHPNIVPVHEVGEHAGNPYFTMDYIHGRVLSRMLRESGALPPRRAVQVVREVARALVAAHEKGLVHRDIKPSNVMLADDGRVLLMDFGLAKDMSSDTVRTQSGTTIGTPAYMPPEQARGDNTAISERSDVYSLGAVLFECLTGRAPFEGEGMVEVVMRVLEQPPPAPRRLNP
ncbi:MAG TPA: serine/threonine protein kinase, partial [Planctomycetes bacterium]|nr:serine/threonine protein kinase [Planctomycetota bacterium]